MNKKVSVILPSYNYEKFISEAIDSVLAQTYQDWELIIVDDGSRDGSVAVIEQYTKRTPDKIKLFFHEGRQNKGMVETYKLGLRNCTGDTVAFLEADDSWGPDNLAAKVEVLEKYPEVAVVHSAVEIFGEKTLAREQERKYTWREFPAPHATGRPFYAFGYLMRFNFVMTFSTFMTKKENLADIDFAVSHTPWLDWWLLTQLSLKGKFFYLPESLVRWRVHANNYNRHYCRGVDEFREGTRLKLEIFLYLKNRLGRLNEAGKGGGGDLRARLNRAVKREAAWRIVNYLFVGIKRTLKKILPKAWIEPLKSMRERILSGGKRTGSF